MSVTTVAYRYAQALIDLSTEQKTVDKVNDDMVQLSTICKESEEFENFLNSPIIDARKKTDIFKILFEAKMEKISFGFMNLIVKNERENLIPQIAQGFINLYKKSKNIVEATVVSAIKLDTATKKTIIDKIKAATGASTIEVTEEVDASLIGGFIVKMDDKQIDASISSQLSNLKNILLN